MLTILRASPHTGRKGVFWNREEKILWPPPLGEWSVYTDGSLTPNRPLRSLVENKWLKNHDMALFRHPHRKCAYAEIDACSRASKITKKEAAHAHEILKDRGLPKNFGLWACGVLVRKRGSAQNAALAASWWSYVKKIPRDQIWFPLVVWEMGLKDKINTIDANVFANSYFTYQRHQL